MGVRGPIPQGSSQSWSLWDLGECPAAMSPDRGPTPLREPLLPHPADEETGRLVGHQLRATQPVKAEPGFHSPPLCVPRAGCVCVSAQGPPSPAHPNSQVSPAPSPGKVVMVASEGAGPGDLCGETPPSLTLSLAPEGPRAPRMGRGGKAGCGFIYLRDEWEGRALPSRPSHLPEPHQSTKSSAIPAPMDNRDPPPCPPQHLAPRLAQGAHRPELAWGGWWEPRPCTAGESRLGIKWEDVKTRKALRASPFTDEASVGAREGVGGSGGGGSTGVQTQNTPSLPPSPAFAQAQPSERFHFHIPPTIWGPI